MFGQKHGGAKAPPAPPLATALNIKFKKFKLQDPILFDPQNLKKWLYKLVLKIPFDNKPPLKNSIKIRKNCHNILSNANFSIRNETNLGKLGNTQGMTDGAYISKNIFEI